VLETALDQEMTEQLGHEKNGPVSNQSGNVRDGTAIGVTLAGDKDIIRL
jgi:transposase-like protein